MQGKVAATRDQITSGYATEDIKVDSPILAEEVSFGVPSTLGDVVPPHKQLVTVLLSKPAATEAALCTPYDRLAITGSAFRATEVEGTLARYKVNEPPIPSLLVIAVAPASALLIENTKRDELSVKCKRGDKYEK